MYVSCGAVALTCSAMYPIPEYTLTMESLVDCSKCYVKNDAYGGAGAFATVDIAKGEEVK